MRAHHLIQVNFNLKNLTFIFISLNDKSKFELGYNFGQGDNDETMFYSLYVDSAESVTGKNIYKYKRDIHAIFFEYNAQINDKWSIKPGLDRIC